MPGLSNIPILGWLFKKQTTSTQKTNVMLFITAHIIDTLEDNEKLMQSKRATMEDFNRQGDKEFSKGSFTDTGRSIQLKNEIEGLSPEEAKKSQKQRDKEKAKREKEAKRLEKERQKALEKEAKEKAKQGNTQEKQVQENKELITPVIIQDNMENNNKEDNKAEDKDIITINPSAPEKTGE